MSKYILLFFVLTFISCSEKEKPVLTIGSSLNKSGFSVSVKGTNNITQNEQIAFVLKQESEFNISKILMRIYKFLDSFGSESKIIYSEEVDINPTYTFIANEIDAEKFITEYGDGRFQLQFLIDSKEIASGEFTLLPLSSD